MKKLRNFVILVVIWVVGNVEAKEICPKMCTCDIFESYKRADCSDQNLASPHTNVAKSVEILNLSGNEITTIDNDGLKDYKDLIKLSFARNSIHTIEFFAFESLEKLNYLDLSDNRLEIIDGRIFEENEKLTFLDLSKNKFMLIEDKPLIVSSSLEFLSLRNSHLSHVYETMFSELPNLIDLDISNNLLITLQSSAFKPLEQLQFINLEYNRFSCDFRIENTLQLFKQRKVHVKIDKCVKNSKKPMFEKMILHPDLTTETPKEDIEIDLVWGSATSYEKNEIEKQHENGSFSFKDYYIKIKGDEDEEFDCDDDEMFPTTCECQQNFIKFFELSERLRMNQKKNAEMRIGVVFYVGAFLGALSGCVIYYLISIIWKRCEKANKKIIERHKARDRIIMTSVRMAETTPNHSPLPEIRNRLTVPQQEVIIPSRSPIPTPRNPQNRQIEPSPIVQRRTEIIPNIQAQTEVNSIAQRQTAAPRIQRQSESTPGVQRQNQVTPSSLRQPESSSDSRRRTAPSPEVRRRTEPSPDIRRRVDSHRDRNHSQPYRLRVEPSPTAQLIHKLFRNRDPRLLPDPTELTPLTPTNSRRASPRLAELRIEEEAVYSEIPSPTATVPTAPAPTEPDDDSGSEYLSIDNLSLNLNFDSIRNESITPPPAYDTIHIDEK